MLCWRSPTSSGLFASIDSPLDLDRPFLGVLWARESLVDIFSFPPHLGSTATGLRERCQSVCAPCAPTRRNAAQKLAWRRRKERSQQENNAARSIISIQRGADDGLDRPSLPGVPSALDAPRAALHGNGDGGRGRVRAARAADRLRRRASIRSRCSSAAPSRRDSRRPRASAPISAMTRSTSTAAARPTGCKAGVLAPASCASPRWWRSASPRWSRQSMFPSGEMPHRRRRAGAA